ncbi:MAG: membrane dipeptidase [Acidobacteriota bacterium]
MRSVEFAGVVVLAGATIAGAGASLRGDADWKAAYPGLILADGHTHDLVPREGAAPRQGELERARAAGMNGVILSFPLEPTRPEDLVGRIRRDMSFVRTYAAEKGVSLAFVDRFDFSPPASASGPLQVLPSLEYFDGVFSGGLAILDALHDAGVRSITLVDRPGDGLSEGRGDALRLSDFGRRTVGRMNDLGMAIDISHLPEELQRDVIRASRRPVLASHSNVRAVAAAGRNLSDDILKEMSGRGGLVLLTFDREYLLGDSRDLASPGLPRLLAHVAHAVEVCGVDHVGIGTDFGGSGEHAPADLSGIECFEAIARAMTNNGYTVEAVRKVLGGNLIRFHSGRREAVSEADGSRQEEVPLLADVGQLKGAYLGQPPPGLVPELFAPGIVTSEQGEGCSGWGTDPEWFLFQRWVDRTSVLFLRSREAGTWSDAVKLPWAERYQVGDFTVGPDGRTLAFVSNIPIEGLGAVGEGGNVWIAQRIPSGWAEPRSAGPAVNSDFHDSYPSLAASGSLYFFSRRPGGFGQSDLYVSRRSGGRYLPAENLGPILNTDAHEWDPYVAPDESYLIFNSMKAGGLGGDDFYISWRTASGDWGDPVHLGAEINSPGSDNRPYVTADGRYFFFTSDRRGNRDIYWVDARILERFRPKSGR